MQDEDAHFQEQVRQCFEELGQLLGELANQHPTLVVLAALSEELGRGLSGCHRSGACSAAHVREILGRMETLIFTDDAGLPPPEVSR
jgi:hypothetical protein